MIHDLNYNLTPPEVVAFVERIDQKIYVDPDTREHDFSQVTTDELETYNNILIIYGNTVKDYPEGHVRGCLCQDCKLAASWHGVRLVAGLMISLEI